MACAEDDDVVYMEEKEGVIIKITTTPCRRRCVGEDKRAGKVSRLIQSLASYSHY